MSEVTRIRIRRGDREHVLHTWMDWREVLSYLAGKFTDGRDIGGPELPVIEQPARRKVSLPYKDEE